MVPNWFFGKKKIFENFWIFLIKFWDGNGWVEDEINPTASNGVPLEPSRPKELKNVDEIFLNCFCPVSELFFQISTRSKSPPFSSNWPSTNYFIHKKDSFGACDMCNKLQYFKLFWLLGQISVAKLKSHQMEKIRALFYYNIYPIIY